VSKKSERSEQHFRVLPGLREVLGEGRRESFPPAVAIPLNEAVSDLFADVDT
jgi:hypothetical protein